MTDLNQHEAIANLKEAMLRKHFCLCVVETNKGNQIPLAIARTLVNEMHLAKLFKNLNKIPEQLSVKEYGTSKILQDVKVVFVYNENWCVGGLEAIHEFSEIQCPTETIGKPVGFVLGIAGGITATLEAKHQLNDAEFNIQAAILKAEQTRKFNTYSAIPELHDLMNSLELKPEHF